jgi:hypothetical protein
MSAFQQARKSRTSDCNAEVQLAENRVLEEFCRDRARLEALKVTEKELQALSRAALLGTLSSDGDIEFILRQIRRPLIIGEAPVEEPKSTKPTPDPRQMTESIRLAALAKLNRIEAREAWRNAGALRRIMMLVGWRDHSSPGGD